MYSCSEPVPAPSHWDPALGTPSLHLTKDKHLCSLCLTHSTLGSWLLYTACEESFRHLSAWLLPQKLTSTRARLATGSETFFPAQLYMLLSEAQQVQKAPILLDYECAFI